MSPGPKRLNDPHPIRVRAGARGMPLTIEGRRVDAVRESWLVEDRWWTGDDPVRRRYWEVVTDDGRSIVVFRDIARGGWFSQRG